MNGDALELSRMITAMGDNLSQKMDEHFAKMNEFKGSMTSRITNAENDIAEMKEDQKTQANRQWIHSIVVLCLNAAHHIASNYWHWPF